MNTEKDFTQERKIRGKNQTRKQKKTDKKADTIYQRGKERRESWKKYKWTEKGLRTGKKSKKKKSREENKEK